MIDDEALGVGVEALWAKLAAKARELRAASRDTEVDDHVLVDPDRARLDPHRDVKGAIEIAAPNRCAKT